MKESIVKGDAPGRCFICSLLGKIGKTDPDADQSGPFERHHIFGGANRSKSEEYGITVYLCAYHHRTGPTAVHVNSNTMDNLHKIGQKAFEQKYGHGRFVQEFGKNYLNPEEWTW